MKHLCAYCVQCADKMCQYTCNMRIHYTYNEALKLYQENANCRLLFCVCVDVGLLGYNAV